MGAFGFPRSQAREDLKPLTGDRADKWAERTL
jgi:hypothetical protein